MSHQPTTHKNLWKAIKSFFSISLLGASTSALTAKSPTYCYDLSSPNRQVKLTGTARLIEFNGRSGIHLTSKHSRLELPAHTLGEKKGTAVIWLMPLEDLTPMIQKDTFGLHDSQWHTYPLLIDSSDQTNENNSKFSLAWNVFNSPGFYARFYSGYYHKEVWAPQAKAFVRANGASFFSKHWYQVALTWNHEAKEYAIYINGIKVADRNRFPEIGVPDALFRETPNPTVFTGNPMWAISEVNFYSVALDETDTKSLFIEGMKHQDLEEQTRLEKRYLGKGLQPFKFKPDENWKPALNLSLKDQEQLKLFYVQGMKTSARIESDGLHIETANVNQPMKFTPGQDDTNQMYLWSEKTFEGDLYVKFQFKSLLPGGLSLLMLQASGMQREDFLTDYPRRTTGSMQMVSWEDVRNYQWEYYREMNDTRNDVSTHYFKKNPTTWLMAYQDVPGLLSDGQWHQLEYLQEGNHLRGAIDGLTVVDVLDHSKIHHGPVLTFGRLGLRCMLRTHMVFKDLEVKNKTSFNTRAW